MKKILFILALFLSIVAHAQQGLPTGNIYLNAPVINVVFYGAKGDMKSFADGVINGTTTFTSATANFVAADAGKTIRITNAGPSVVDLITTIASVSNSTTVILSASASGSGSAKAFDYGTNNTTALQNAANAIPITGGTLNITKGY